MGEIIAGEIEIPDGTVAPGADELRTLILGKIARGRMVARACAGIGAAGAIACVIVSQWIGAAALAGGAILAGLALLGVERKIRIGRIVLDNPGRVTGAHAKQLDLGSGPMWFLSLHVDGTHAYEVSVARERIPAVAKWIRDANPRVKLGAP